MKDLLTRIIAGLVYAGLLVFSILFGLKALSTLMILVCIIGMYEIYQLSKVQNKLQVLLGIFSAAALVLSIGIGLFIPNWLILPLFFLFLVELFNFKEFSFKNIGITLTGLLLIAIPASLAIKLTLNSEGYDGFFLLQLFILIWINDSFAYLIGSLFGRHKLYESISPNKTWEGFFGGIFATILAALFIFESSTFMQMKLHLLFALVVSIFGTLGDLIESMFKRKANIKDSGNLIPGHGGILDRFDSFFFSIPFVYLIIEFIT